MHNWDWRVLLQQVPSGETTYLGWLFVGLKWTVLLGLSSWALALVLGFILGIMRTMPQKLPAIIAAAYVELFRNVPLLVQLFVWHFVLPEFLPRSLGEAYKAQNPLFLVFIEAVVCLGFFTAARVCEQVRSGIHSLGRDQKNAALALGLTLFQTYRLVLVPRAVRVIIPPLTSEFLNVFKNSAVASTIGLIELSRQAQQLNDYTAQGYVSFVAVTVGYFAINFAVMLLMRVMETATRVPGTMSGVQ